jgi:ABC-2 type transport system permease protein
MMRLLKVELGRLFSRRLIRAVAIVGLLGFLAIDGLIAAKSSTDVAAAHLRADAMVQSQYQSCLAQVPATQGSGSRPTKADCENQLPAAQLKNCLAAVEAQGNTSGPGRLTREQCIREGNPYFQDPRFHFADHAANLLSSAAFIFMMLGLLIGASFIGAEWQAGTFASLLTWEPRRQRVLGAKLTAAVIGLGLLGTVLTSAFVGGAAVAANLRGTMDGTTMHLMAQLGVMAARVLGLVALFTLIGAALATFTRHTVGAVAVAGGYLVLGELVGAIVSPWWRNHSLGAQITAVIQGRYVYYVNPPRGVELTSPAGVVGTVRWHGEHYLHAGGASIIIGLLTLVLVAIASITLRRRDVV